MTLTNRLTLFFLVSEACLLIVVSVAVYVLTRTHLLQQLNDRGSSTLDTLMAATEIEADGLEWEPKDRRMLFRGDVPPIWGVYDHSGGRIDGYSDDILSLNQYATNLPDAEQSRVNITWSGEHWRILRRKLSHDRVIGPRSDRYHELIFVTAWSVAPVHRILAWLAWSLAGVSLILWWASAFGSRWVCRRALRPVRRMAEAAKRITSDNLGDRLPISKRRDELGELAIAFNDLLARVETSFERQRRFTGEASHQLRTPLTAMLGQMEVALRRERDSEEYRRVLRSAMNQAGRLQGIVEMLLFLARADAESRMPRLKVIDLNEWLLEHLSEMWGTHPRFANLNTQLASEPVRVSVQPALLGQALFNLVENAFKYSSPDTTVRIRLIRATNALIVVEDRGIGIRAEEIPHVFESFFRSEDVRKRGIPGAGLGLAVTERIVKAFGGSLELWSEAGQGSRFSITLPLEESLQSLESDESGCR